MNAIARPRRRVNAVLLSLLFPGLGELYAGQPERAAVSFVGFHVVVVAAVASLLISIPGVIAVALVFVMPLGAWVVVAVRAARAAARAPDPYLSQSYNRWYWYVLAILIGGFIWQPGLFRLLRSQGVEAFRIPSRAMEPTILSGDFIFVSKRPVSQPARNDIVVLQSPTSDGLFIIKRIAGIPGDTIEARNGALSRDGVLQIEPFAQATDSSSESGYLREGRAWQVAHLVSGDPRTYRPDMRNWGPIVIPPDSVFVLGDNRDESFDSRSWGAVGIDRLRGRPLVIYFSVNRDRGGSFIRWNRIGNRF